MCFSFNFHCIWTTSTGKLDRSADVCISCNVSLQCNYHYIYVFVLPWDLIHFLVISVLMSPNQGISQYIELWTKTGAMLHMTLAENEFYWRKIFRFAFYSDLVLKVQMTSQHWFSEWVGAEQTTSYYPSQSYMIVPIHVDTQLAQQYVGILISTVKPVCNDHLFNKINYLWFIQKCVLMKTEGTKGHLDEPQ